MDKTMDFAARNIVADLVEQQSRKIRRAVEALAVFQVVNFEKAQALDKSLETIAKDLRA